MDNPARLTGHNLLSYYALTRLCGRYQDITLIDPDTQIATPTPYYTVRLRQGTQFCRGALQARQRALRVHLV